MFILNNSFLLFWERKCTSFSFNSRTLLVAIEKFANFHANGFPLIVYQSADFVQLKEWVSNCQNIESPNLLIESQLNAVSDDDIQQRLKRYSALEAAYEKLLILGKEKSELVENIDFCVLGMVEELAQNDRADVSEKEVKISISILYTNR